MISVRRSVPIFFVLLVILSSSVIIVTYYISSKNSVNSLLDEVVEVVKESVVKETVSFLDPAREVGEITRQMSAKFLLPELQGKYYAIESKEYKENARRVDGMLEYFDKRELRKNRISETELKTFLLKKTSKSIGILKLFEGYLKTHEQINLINYGNYAKDKVMLKRMPDGSFSMKYVYHYEEKGLGITCWYHSNPEYYLYSKADDRYDFGNELSPSSKTYNVLLRPWFLGAEKEYKSWNENREEIKSFWTKPYVFYSDQVPGISCSNPLLGTRGQIVGAISVSLTIYNISAKYLANLDVGKSGKVFIMTERGNMLAYSPSATKGGYNFNKEELIKRELRNLITQTPRYSKTDGTKIIGYKFTLTGVDKLKDKIYNRLIEEGKSQGILISDVNGYRLTREDAYKYDYGGIAKIGVLFPFPAETGLNWIVGIIIPEEDFLGEINSNTYIVIGISVFTTIFLFLFSIYIFSKISTPLYRLSDTTRRVAEFDLTALINIKSPLVEINQMVNAVDNMVKGLRSFEKYVPSKLVKQLIRSGEEAKLGGTSKKISIFFSDIVEFTNLSEALNPKDLVMCLGEYLEEMSQIIHTNKGTLDKYIGDAIMSFWGAPEPCEDGAYLACKVAIESQKRLSMLRYAKWKPESKPLFASRIGIHTGEAIVGNMGSESRMNYTILGDAVNVCSRLEGLNSYYGTNIICSDTTQKLISDKIFTRRLDVVAVKGKSEPLGIYEVIDFHENMTKQEIEFVGLYEYGLKEYTAGNLKEAQKVFKEVNMLRIDTAARVFIERCEKYLTEGLPSVWRGVEVYTSK